VFSRWPSACTSVTCTAFSASVVADTQSPVAVPQTRLRSDDFAAESQIDYEVLENVSESPHTVRNAYHYRPIA